MDSVESVVTQVGNDESRNMQATLEQETREAIQSHDADFLRRKIDELRQFIFEVLSSDPGFWRYLFEESVKEKAQMSDPTRADQWIREGNQAIQNNNLGQLVEAVRQLNNLLPREVQNDITRGYGSSLIK